MAALLTEEMQYMGLSIALFGVIIPLLSRRGIFREALRRTSFPLHQSILFVLAFSAIGVVGAYWTIDTGTGVISTRAAGVVTGGFLGGPFVGCATGLVTGLYRLAFTESADPVLMGALTFLQGIAAGYLSFWIKKGRRKWLRALLAGFFLESANLLLFLFFEASGDEAARAAEALGPSMIITNTVVIALFVGILEAAMKEQEEAVSHAAKVSFRAVNLVLSMLEKGVTPSRGKGLTAMMMDALPDLEWAAVATKEEVRALSARGRITASTIKKEVHQFLSSGDERRFPYMMMTTVKNNGGIQRWLIVRKKENLPLNSYERELVTGSKQILEVLFEFDRLKRRDALYSQAEIKALQAQINPHFLFNALNTIGFYCRSRPGEARKLVLYLADYYRQHLVSPGAMIPLQKELAHVEAYVNIEQARFGDRLHVEYHIESTDVSVPALILEPIVENALRHGIFPKEEGGRVKIAVLARKNWYRFLIGDDGTGIDRETKKALLDRSRKRTSIGLINVNSRLISLYGKESGLTIRSRPGRGTIVSFKIPREAAHLAGEGSMVLRSC